jgi:hypothetical protein
MNRLSFIVTYIVLFASYTIFPVAVFVALPAMIYVIYLRSKDIGYQNPVLMTIIFSIIPFAILWAMGLPTGSRTEAGQAIRAQASMSNFAK